MSKKHSMKPVALAIGAAFAATVAVSAAQANENPFGATALSSGYMISHLDDKSKDGSCGADKGKSGDKAKEAHCGTAKEGHCGGDKKAKEAHCGSAKEGHCGGDKKAKDDDKDGDKGKEGSCGGRK